MKQLLTRIDDRLHAQLKQLADQKGSSVNTLVNDILIAGVGATNPRVALRARLRASGQLVVPPQPARAPSWEEVEVATRGLGQAVSEALDADRGRW